MKKYNVIGLMSGTSMDGVDLAYCEFEELNNTWHFKIVHAETIPYPEVWITRLTKLHEQPIFLYPKTDAFYGKYLGQLVNDFIKKNNLKVDLISSHGHTIFHQPENGFTAQIGDGASIHAETNLPVVCNFRTVDVALGGQGAPLVPIGDRDLFSEYDACLNLGGFANISFTKNKTLKAFDICACNIILNQVAKSMNLDFDDEGKIARSGKINEELLIELNAIDFYRKQGAKSLGREWVNEFIWPLIKKYQTIISEDLLATFTEHIAIQITESISNENAKMILVTGGGTFNSFLIELIKKKVSLRKQSLVDGTNISQFIIPGKTIINYKEALVFSYLGLLYFKRRNNVTSCVTGSKRDHIGGALYGPNGC